MFVFTLFLLLLLLLLYVAWKRGLPRKCARFVLFRLIKKRFCCCCGGGGGGGDGFVVVVVVLSLVCFGSLSKQVLPSNISKRSHKNTELEILF